MLIGKHEKSIFKGDGDYVTRFSRGVYNNYYITYTSNEHELKEMEIMLTDASSDFYNNRRKIWDLLEKIGYEWSNDYQIWASQTDYLLPPLTAKQATELMTKILEEK